MDKIYLHFPLFPWRLNNNIGNSITKFYNYLIKTLYFHSSNGGSSF